MVFIPIQAMRERPVHWFPGLQEPTIVENDSAEYVAP